MTRPEKNVPITHIQREATIFLHDRYPAWPLHALSPVADSRGFQPVDDDIAAFEHAHAQPREGPLGILTGNPEAMNRHFRTVAHHRVLRRSPNFPILDAGLGCRDFGLDKGAR